EETPLTREQFVDLTRALLNFIREHSENPVPGAAAWRDWLQFLDGRPDQPDYTSLAVSLPEPVFRWWMIAHKALCLRHRVELGQEKALRLQFLTRAIYDWYRVQARELGLPWITFYPPLP